jgi:hypothetical protein
MKIMSQLPLKNFLQVEPTMIFTDELVENNFFSLLVLEGVIIESRTEPRSRISLLLVDKFNFNF